MLKYIFLGLLYSIFNTLPLSLSGHRILYQNIFNTEMFNTLNITFLINIGIGISFIFILRKSIFKILKKENKNETINLIKNILFLIPLFIIINLFILKTIHPILLAMFILINAFLLIKIKFNDESSHQLTKKNLIIISICILLSIFPGISLIATLLFSLSLSKIKKEKAFEYLLFFYLTYLFVYFLINLPGFVTYFEYYLVLNYSICIITSILVTYYSTQLLKKLIYQNKLKNIAFYLFFLSVFILFYFR